jgi:hypothetical protein
MKFLVSTMISFFISQAYASEKLTCQLIENNQVVAERQESETGLYLDWNRHSHEFMVELDDEKNLMLMISRRPTELEYREHERRFGGLDIGLGNIAVAMTKTKLKDSLSVRIDALELSAAIFCTTDRSELLPTI